MLDLKFEPYNLLHLPVNKFEFDQDPEEIEKNMIEIMLKSQGIGLAANQVGLNAQLFVMGALNLEGFIQPRIIINPSIVRLSDEKTVSKEGCLSFPGLALNIKRPQSIDAVFQDTKGNWIEMKAEGYMAKCFQHEFDHLHGVCYTDRVSKLKLNMAVKKMRKGTR